MLVAYPCLRFDRSSVLLHLPLSMNLYSYVLIKQASGDKKFGNVGAYRSYKRKTRLVYSFSVLFSSDLSVKWIWYLFQPSYSAASWCVWESSSMVQNHTPFWVSFLQSQSSARRVKLVKPKSFAQSFSFTIFVSIISLVDKKFLLFARNRQTQQGSSRTDPKMSWQLNFWDSLLVQVINFHQLL